MSRRTILQALPARPGVGLPEALPDFPQPSDPVALFAGRLEEVGGHFFANPGADQLAGTISRLIRDFGGGPVLWESASLIEKLGLGPDPGHEGWVISDAATGVLDLPVGCRPVLPDKLTAAEASVSVARADWGIAETGGIVQSAGAGRGRALPVVAPAHLAVLARDRLLGTTADFYNQPAAAGSVAVVVTGPSRTADIEKKLIMGVHGPRFMGVVLV